MICRAARGDTVTATGSVEIGCNSAHVVYSDCSGGGVEDETRREWAKSEEHS